MSRADEHVYNFVIDLPLCSGNSLHIETNDRFLCY